jgi:hypothetical protein
MISSNVIVLTHSQLQQNSQNDKHIQAEMRRRTVRPRGGRLREPSICGRPFDRLIFSSNSQNMIVHFACGSEACLVVAGVNICVSGESAMATGLVSDRDVIIPSSVFFSSLSATLLASGIGHDAFARRSMNVLAISRHVRILGSYCFSYRNSLSSISFETDSELTRIESMHFQILLSNQSQFLEMFDLLIVWLCQMDLTVRGRSNQKIHLLLLNQISLVVW